MRTQHRRPRLKLKNPEQFQETLIAQYRDMIHEAILESETDHKTRLDIGRLNHKLQLITKAAQYDGLSENIVDEMIDGAVNASGLKAA